MTPVLSPLAPLPSRVRGASFVTISLVISLVGAAIVACSPSTVPSPGTTSADQACTDSANTKCAAFASCASAVPQLRYGDLATCQVRLKAQCLSTLSAPGTGSSPESVEACASAFDAGSWACRDWLDNENPPLACESRIGSISPGAACASSSQCTTGFCRIIPGQACGLCGPPPSPGDSCKTLTNCGLGLTCTSDTKTCVFFGRVGDPCGTGAPCGAGTWCVGSNTQTGMLGTCQPSVSMVGAACDPTGTTGPGCERNIGLECNSMTRTCQTTTIAAANQSCVAVNNLGVFCAAGAACTDMGGGVKTCVNAVDGATCDLNTGPSCVTPARCIVPANSPAGSTTGTCQLVLPTCGPQ